MNIIVNSYVDNTYVNVRECEKCLKLETELLNKKDLVEKEIYDKLFRSYTTLEKHCISLEIDTQLNQEIFQKDNFVSNQSAPSFDQYFEFNELKAHPNKEHVMKSKKRIKSLSGNMNDVSVTRFGHYSSSMDELKELKGKRSAHFNYLKHTQVEAAILREIVELGKLQHPLHNSLDSACKYTKRIQELLIIIGQTCPSINNFGDKLVFVTSKNKEKRVRFTKPVTSSGNTHPKTDSSSNLVSNKLALPSIGVRPSTSASGSQSSGNTTKDKIQRTPSSTQKNNVKAHPMTVKSSSKNKNCFVEPKRNANVQHSKLNANYELLCVKCNGWMLFDNHDLCVLDFINDVNARNKSKYVKKSSKRKVWKPTINVGLHILATTCETYFVINHLARHGLVRGLPKLKFEKDHLCSACAMGKSKKKE
ncbi:hypothetical protein Tco_0690231 [Tanacetum coccineum]